MTILKKWRHIGSMHSWPFTAEWVAHHQPDNGRVLWVDFSIWPIIACNVDAPDVPLYQRKGAMSSPDTVENTDDAELLVEGFLKWDGCNEVQWGDEDVHCCGLDDRKSHYEALAMTLRTAVREFMSDTYTCDDMPEGDWLKPVLKNC